MAAATTYPTTRGSLHAVAEHVLAAALHEATGRIGLRATSGGFGTPRFPGRGGTERQVRIDGTDLVVDDEQGTRRSRLQTVGDAAAVVGIVPGGPSDLYPLATPLDPDAALVLDPDAVATIHAWFRLTDRALDALRREQSPEPPPAQLWPEHFDLAVTIAEVNYGGSPGDDQHDGPYLYVGPWHLDGADEFWNEPFGASLPQDNVQSVDDALTFFRRGRTLAAEA